MVLISERPVAPASAQARAMVTMSVTSGDSLARTGTSRRVTVRTALTTSAEADGDQANIRPRSSALGQATLTSIAAIGVGEASSLRAISPNSATLLPPTDTI